MLIHVQNNISVVIINHYIYIVLICMFALLKSLTGVSPVLLRLASVDISGTF